MQDARCRIQDAGWMMQDDWMYSFTPYALRLRNPNFGFWTLNLQPVAIDY